MTSTALTYARLLVAELEAAERQDNIAHPKYVASPTKHPEQWSDADIAFFANATSQPYQHRSAPWLLDGLALV
jgi:hypothetical protein